MSFPKIQPIKLKEYTSKQSKYNQCAKLPMRSIVLGPSGSGKTILLQNMILDIYEGCFDKIYIFHLVLIWTILGYRSKNTLKKK
jgi:hypothetical protein